MDVIKPLTPDLRRKINDGFDKQIRELERCQQNGFVRVQIAGYENWKRLINSLPDGYPMPFKRGE